MYKNKKKYGQNFLSDINLLKKIVNEANLKNKNVVEIGPGKGALTQFIILQSKKFLAYEIDEKLKPFLIFEKNDNFKIIYDDFLKRNLKEDFFNYFGEEKITLIGNLPYYITTPLIFKFLEEKQINSFTIMLQKEVGLRLLAKPNTKNYNALSVIIQFLTKIKNILEVNKNMFKPKPKVDSIVLKFDKKNQKNLTINFKNNFFIFVKISFRQKRKTLINNLEKGYKISKKKIIIFFDTHNIKYCIRAEQLSVEFFQEISYFWFIFLKNIH
ncbi:16S rRNA (adenine(1518)-N(6)/adenine(1519)-N(6))-dimethyltransferase RsmA [Candidatus Phytoplasma prunorum]|uniref:16S rRNA (adenine(1518)-N(6)/adenine(1519)-N(6))- dimethyltransferase RsmA n=1 Tax=Candidatus Phytoplasma prunorum TaxID=47565 RepID=UPI002FEEE6A9